MSEGDSFDQAQTIQVGDLLYSITAGGKTKELISLSHDKVSRDPAPIYAARRPSDRAIAWTGVGLPAEEDRAGQCFGTCPAQSAAHCSLLFALFYPPA